MGLATMMAQDTKQCAQQGEKPCQKLTAEQKAQLITDRMAKAYDLTADQKAKLLDLNLKALQKCQPMPCPKGKPECDKAGKAECDKGKPCPDGEKKCDKEGKPCKFNGPFPYMKGLSEILTPEQLAAWRTDKMIERSLMPRRPQMRGHFGHRGPQGHGFRGGPCPQSNCSAPKGKGGCPMNKAMCSKDKADCCKTACKDCCKNACKDCCKNACKDCCKNACKDCNKKCTPCKCAGKCSKQDCKKCKACNK